MKIKSISCTQFAGIRDRDVSFTDGINVIYGKNESGKSTLVNLLSRTLFQDVKLKLSTKEGKAFADLYLPGAKKGDDTAGDFADGKITFETEKGVYTLSKEWGVDARCALSTPHGVIRDQNKITDILAEALLYGEGVYTDMLFSSQRNTDMTLQTILDASKKTDAKQEITNAVSQAFAESDGISVDAIEDAIAAEIEEIAGKHWDEIREAPVRKAGRWSKDLGKILKAYYLLEDAQTHQKAISSLEEKADHAANDYIGKDVAAREAEDEYNRFSTYARRLAVQSERKKVIDRNNEALKRIAEILSEWPRLSEQLETAKRLQTEKKDRDVLDLWNSVQKTLAELSAEDHKTAEWPQPEIEEIAKVKKEQRNLYAYENKLRGMNINAAVKMLNGDQVQIVCLRTGETVEVSEGSASITEAVKIIVPGVMEMQLAPADVDIVSVEAEIAQLREAIATVFAKYKVETLEELEAYSQKIDAAKKKISSVNTRIESALGNTSLAQLEELYRSAGAVYRSKEEIERDVFSVCRGIEIDKFITKTETIIDGYVSEFGSINDLKAKAFDLREELKMAEASGSNAEDIPTEYQCIDDPEGHLQDLANALKDKRELRELAFTEKTSTAISLETYKDTHAEACSETVQKAEKALEEAKALLKHWRHIEAVFKKQKENLHNNPMQDIADRFGYYLSIISGGRVSSDFPDTDKLNMHIYSENNLLDFNKLSEGTKETVSLAFRLAVLDHLFPEGGGVIVFDDPFTDMDADRTAQSCRLIKECATRHQVVFLTCNESYLRILEGNHILF